MELLYFLDWCPVNTLPVHNGLWKSDGLTRRSAKELGNAKVRQLFERFSSLMTLEFAVRLDGIFLFRLGLQPGAQPDHRTDLPREVSELVKSLTGHSHEFHAYPYAGAQTKSGLMRRVWRGFKGCCKTLLTRFTPIQRLVHRQLDIDLHIQPVEIEDPCTEEFKARTGKRFVKLEDILDPRNKDASLAQLRVRYSGGQQADSPQRACLRLRALFVGKKDRCMRVYIRRSKWSSSIVLPILAGILVAVLAFYVMNDYLVVGFKTSLVVSMIAGFGAFIVVDDKRQAPKLAVIQRTLGFYSYANIYSRLTEAMYKGVESGPAFNSATGNFDDLQKALQTRLDYERQLISNRKYIWTIAFAMIAATVALVKLSVELERITTPEAMPTCVVCPSAADMSRGGAVSN